MEVQPAGRLDRGRGLGLRHPQPALQPAARSRLRLDRLRPLHAARHRARGTLGRAGPHRVRAARGRLSPVPAPLGRSLLLAHGSADRPIRPRRGRAGGDDGHRRRVADDPAAHPRFGAKPVVAIGTDLAYAAITKTVGGWRHLRKGTVDLRLTAWMAIGSAPGSLVGVYLVERLHDRYGAAFDNTLLIAVGSALAVMSMAILARALFMPRLDARERDSVEMTRRDRVSALTIGAVLGLVLGFTSVGSGALIGLALILVFRLTPHRVVGTDVFHAAILLWVAGFAHLVAGNVDLVLMANILIGSIPGVWIGTALMTRVPAGGLRIALGCVLLGSSLGIFSKAGVEVPAWAIVGLPLRWGLSLRCATLRRRPRDEFEVAHEDEFAPSGAPVPPPPRRQEAAPGGHRRDHALRALRDLPPARAGGRGDPHHARGRRRAGEPGAAVLRRQGLARAAAPGAQGVPPGALPLPGHARRHRPQLPRGDRVPRPPDRVARRAPDRGLGAGLDRRRPREGGDRPACLAQPPADHDAARRDRGARLRRRLRRRAPRRGARPGQGARVLLPRRLRPVGPQGPAPRAVVALQRPRAQGRARARVPDLQLDRARRVAVHLRGGASSCRRSTSPTGARCSAATGCSTRSATSSS